MTNWEIIQGRWRGEISVAGSNFDKVATPAIIAFEAVVLTAFVAALLLLPRLAKRVPLRFMVMACGVLIFELFTGPMWRNLKMGEWAYLFQGVSWILTLGWCTLILGTVMLVDHFGSRLRELRRFAIYLAVLTPAVVGFEIWLHAIGLRRYAPEVMESVSGVTICGVPMEVLYYAPVFLTLIIGFYKYWSFVIDGVPVIPLPRVPWLRTLAISVTGVLLFELMVEPMVRNQGFPAWSYVYKDVTFLMTGFWVLVLWLSVNLVDRFLMHWDLANRFLAYLGVTALLAIPVESWLIASEHRVYGPSTVANFSRLTLPWTDIPVEVAFGIPLYFALVIGFVRYIEIALTNRNTLYVR
jgi:hypothetical protein